MRSRVRRHLSLAGGVLLAALCVPALAQQFYFGSGTASLRKDQDVVIQSQTLIIAVARSGQKVYGYSEATGSWGSVPLQEGQKGSVVPIVSDEVACFVHGTRVYAFSGRTGTWSFLEPEQLADPAVSQRTVQVREGSRIHMFSASSGSWDSVDLAK